MLQRLSVLHPDQFATFNGCRRGHLNTAVYALLHTPYIVATLRFCAEASLMIQVSVRTMTEQKLRPDFSIPQRDLLQ